MNVKQRIVTVAELTEGYFNDDEEGVVAYDESLDVRPPYQREFVYKDAQRDEVIRSVLAGFPLSVFYWAVAPDGKFEMLDGQQRTMSICEYVEGNFTVDGMLFDNLPADKRQAILDYELIVYVCDGTDSEKLKWFQVINIAGEKLTDQELRNAVYAGSWVSDARRYFSKTGGPAYQLAGDYMRGDPIRQEYLQTVLGWAADKDDVEDITHYMAVHQHDSDAKALWNYYRKVVKWIKDVFPDYYADMKGLPWGVWYNAHHDAVTTSLSDKVRELREDAEVTRTAGIYPYLLTGDESSLSLRQFDTVQKREMYARQGGVCPYCKQKFELGQMHGDHIVPWSKGGKTVVAPVDDPLKPNNTQNGNNGQMLCHACNQEKGASDDLPKAEQGGPNMLA